MKKQSMITLFSIMFVTLIIIPFITMAVFVNYQYSGIILDYETQSLESEIMDLSENLEDQIDSAIYLGAGLTVANQGKILNYVSRYIQAEDVSEKYELNTKIKEMINYLVCYNKSNIVAISFYKNPQQYYEYGTIYNASQRIDPNWYQKTLDAKGLPYVINPLLKDSSYQNFISVGFKVIQENNSGIEVVMITIKTNVFEDIYHLYQASPYKQMCILGDDRETVFSSGLNTDTIAYIKNKDIGEYTHYATINDSKKYIFSTCILKSSWEVITVVDYDRVIEPIKEMTLKCLIPICTCIFLFSIFAFVLLMRIIQPIQNIITHMNSIRDGNLTEISYFKGNYEIKELIDNFNVMIRRLRSSIEEREQQQKEKNYMEIKVLQSQIMPHFVINTLNSIRLMAVINRQDNIAEMSGAFIKLLDATLSRTGDFITIQDEIENIENYIYIMKFRYGDNFQYTITCDPALLHAPILHLLLQPIVENAIIHAFREIEKEGLLTITIEQQQGNILIIVTDNGAGMTEQQAKELLQSSESQDKKRYSHIGISNVNQRIKLHYGEEYGLSIHSSVGNGTQIKIVYPDIREANSLDENIDC